MKRFVQLAMVLTGIVGSVATTSAQPAADQGRIYAELTGGATFGDVSSGSIGAEGGFWLTRMFGVYLEAGQMKNVASSEIQEKATLIATALGTTAEAKQKANYFSVGVVARFPMGRLTPMAFFGAGSAGVTNSTEFAVEPGSSVQLGGDLEGNYRKGFVTAGVGARASIMGPWFADISYRYGSIGAHTDFELDGLKTNRLQFGAGYTF